MDEKLTDIMPDYTSDDSYKSIGLPADIDDYIIPGFQKSTIGQEPSPYISSVDSIWDNIKQDSLGAIDWIGTTADDVGQTAKDLWAWSNQPIIYIPTPREALEGVKDEVSSDLKTMYVYGIVAVIVLVAGIYFIGKSGAIGQAASFGK